ncbi:tRNA lysidine(34) synthetase TilS [Haliea sp. E1-2-M8]|uniref:tRNA lysidine(34) synthetase TilS n=1 Tax=Haliea sp. E1-2-M8 TaxID=3064706 RepID=UPI0027245344|nr:tRNA lysidine(34) synthetase TilS [Haliea sp. E1-2-M8]MDO8861255.1 tRNA lysidine(34) synthetase TilS [Haliea sp. E1-2-M8]
MILDTSSLASALEPHAGAGHWLLAFSGGLDSTVLLHLLHDYRQTHPGAPPLTAVHVNHNLQPAAADWERHCERVCAALGVPLLLRKVAVDADGRGTEAAARDARYRALADTLEAADVMFFAHHQDDQVETLLLRWLRGAGLRGLQGMPALRPLGAGLLSRPLLPWPRAALEACARRHRLQWVDDPSNTDTGFDRNYLRHEVLPLLARRWPEYRGSVVRSARQLGSAAAVLEQLLPTPPPCATLLGDPGIPVSSLLRDPADAGWLVLQEWLAGQGLPAPPRAPVGEFLRQLRSGGGSPELAWSGQRLRRFGDGVYLLPIEEAALWADAGALAPGAPLELPGADRLELVPAGTGPGIALGPGEFLAVRNRSGGERCQPQGKARSQRLKKLLQEGGVPPWWRDRLPLLYLGDELVAVADLWLCASPRTLAKGGAAAWRPLWQRNNFRFRGLS